MAVQRDIAAQFIVDQAKKYPQFSSHYERFEDLYTRKLRTDHLYSINHKQTKINPCT